MKRPSSALFVLLLVGSANAGTISVTCTKPAPFSTGTMWSRGYASYTSFFGNQVNEPVSIHHSIDNTDAGRIFDCTTPCSDTITSTTVAVVPNCYTAHISGTADDSSSTNDSPPLCYYGPPPPPSGGGGGGGGCVVTETNPCTGGGGGSGDTTDYRTDTCYYQVYDCMSPIIFNLQNGGYQLSGMDSSVSFDIDANGSPNRMNWTAAGAQMAFLALDRNGNGRIDDGGELFGDHTRLRDGSIAHNGFDALRELDSNNDGVIDERDSDWQRLLVWIDANHDGVSTPDELHPIGTTGTTAVELSYHWTGRRDKNGNCFRYEGKVHFGGSVKPFYDIYFLVAR